MADRPEDINALAKKVHEANHRWWHDIGTGEPIERNPCGLLALAISEVSECLEGERRGLMDDHLPHRKMAEVEMADTVIRLLDYSAGLGIGIGEISHVRYHLPADKGEALFGLMEIIVLCDGEDLDLTAPEALGIAIRYAERYCEEHGYDLWGALEEKLAYNAHRHDHTHEARAADGGKKF